MSKVLVCGGRDFRDFTKLDRALCDVDNRVCIEEIIHGGAGGADELSNRWAKKYNIPVRVFNADWNLHGKAAGPIRNELMLRQGKPDYVVAFPGGRGTAHMVKIAKRACVTVFEIK